MSFCVVNEHLSCCPHWAPFSQANSEYTIVNNCFGCMHLVWFVFSVCNADYTDIIFVLDGSGSEGSNNFHKQLDFVNLVINEFSIGPAATQVGLVQFYTGARTEINLNSYQDATALMQAVQQVVYR